MNVTEAYQKIKDGIILENAFALQQLSSLENALVL